MIYLEAAKIIIRLYAEYAGKKFASGNSCPDYSEAIALAVEALSIVAGKENKKEEEEVSNGDCRTL